MIHKPLKTLICLVAAGGFGLAYAAPAVAPAAQPASKGDQMQNTNSVQMTVKAVDTRSRTLTLVDKDGDELIVVAGPDVKYVSQARPGDILTTRGVDSVAFTPVAVNNRTTTETQELAKNLPGYAPELMYTSTITTTAKILRVAAKQNMLTVQNVKGNEEKLKVLDPALQARLQTIKAGDNIEITIKHIVDITAQVTEQPKLPSD